MPSPTLRSLGRAAAAEKQAERVGTIVTRAGSSARACVFSHSRQQARIIALQERISLGREAAVLQSASCEPLPKSARRLIGASDH